MSCIYACRVALVVSNSLQPCRLCGLPGFSVRERGSPGRNTGAYCPILVAIPFWSTVFPAALDPNSPEYLVLPEPLRPKQLYHLHTWPSQEQTPVDDPHAGAEIKTQLRPRGSVIKEEDPKPSHQLYKLQIKSTRSTRQTVSIEYAYRAIESSHKTRCTSSDSCGHWRQEHTVGPD